MLLMAVAIAALGALQYAWNFRGLWADLEPPATLAEAVAKFWFDVTKADWRETLVGTVSEAGLQHRPAMYWFDLRQQFGVPGVALAAIGFCYVLWRWPRRGVLLLLIYAANLAFAWTYNVGDAYIFFLPSHYAVALCGRRRHRRSDGSAVARVSNRGARHDRRRAAAALSGLARLRHVSSCRSQLGSARRATARRSSRQGHRPPDAVYGVDTNWQVQNAFEYFMRERKPGVPWFTTEELSGCEEGDRVKRFNDFVEGERGDRIEQ